MKDIRPALREFLLADPAISALVGARISPNVIPQGVDLASVVYRRVSGRGDHHMGGASGLARTRFQIDAWASTADSASLLANLVKSRVDGFRGVMGEGDSATKVLGVFFVDEREDYDDLVRLYRMSRDYFIHYEEF